MDIQTIIVIIIGIVALFFVLRYSYRILTGKNKHCCTPCANCKGECLAKKFKQEITTYTNNTHGK
jgi:hypothetical protein